MIILVKTGSGTIQCDYNPLTGDYTVIGPAPSGSESHTTGHTFNVTKNDRSGNDTNVSVDEVYNQLILTCDLDELETIVDSPTDDEQMTSPFSNRQLYCTEYCAEERGGIRDLVLNGSTGDGKHKICHWYVQLYKSSVWKLNTDSMIPSNNQGQLDFFIQMHERKDKPYGFLCEMGKTEPRDSKDNSIPKAPSMSKYLIITVNGNGDDNESTTFPNDAYCKPSEPIAEYVGNLAGGLFSPTDNETTNYIVISGKLSTTPWRQQTMRRNPLWIIGGDADTTENYFQRVHQDAQDDMMSLKYYNSGQDFGDDLHYYVVKFYDGLTPKSESTTRWSTHNSIYPYNSEWKDLGELKYGWSQNGDETDRISKMPFLACTLKIGNKYACEYTDSSGKAYYRWRTLDECKYTSYQGEKWPNNHIYLGCDIKIDDFITGQEYDFANSVLPEWGIDASGIAIPVSKSDNLSGKVEFTIDGLVNGVFDEITRIHPSFWRHTRWEHDYKMILAHISQIQIKDLEINIYSDNAQINNVAGDKDLIYYTEELTKYTEKKDDIDFSLSTALTTEECTEKGLKNSVFKNNPYIGDQPLRSIHNTVTGFTGKPEEQYLNDYWPEYKDPKQIVETTVFSSPDLVWTSFVKLPEFLATYRIRGIKQDLKLRHTSLTLRQV